MDKRKVNVNCSRYRPSCGPEVGRGIALLFHDRGTRRGWVISSTPRPILPPRKTRYPLYRRLGGLQGRSGRAENLDLPGFDPRTVQPVVSRYTDWATWPTKGWRTAIKDQNTNYFQCILQQGCTNPKRQVAWATKCFRWLVIFVGLQYGICFISLSWSSEFWICSLISGKCAYFRSAAC